MKSKIIDKAFLLGIIATTTICLLPSLVSAKATGICSDCHTMHNSQDGTPMFGDATAYGALTNGGCVGCHTGTNAGGNIPYILDTSAGLDYGTDGTDGNTLAGGNFYWVATTGGNDDAKGHNVVDFANVDGAAFGMTPPGWNPDFIGNGQLNGGGATWATQLTCAGTNGCHGDHTATNDWDAVAGSHHGDDSTIDGSSVTKSFRFLNGIKGLEDRNGDGTSNWEYTPTATAHNQYFGIDKTTDTPTHAGDAKATISYLCAECHGNFHSGAGNLGAIDDVTPVESPWIRHPTDYDMGNVLAKPDYAAYGGAGVHTYSVAAPVGSLDVTSVLGTVYSGGTGVANDDAIVTCISCHRAHGTEFDDLLRWDYSTCNSGTDNALCGCFDCHTTKDAG